MFSKSCMSILRAVPLALMALVVFSIATPPASAQVDGKFSNASASDYGNGPVPSSAKYLSGGLGPDGSVELVSHCGYAGCTFDAQNWTWSGIAFIEAKDKPASLSQITKLSTDFNTTAADCSGGSPRVVIFTASHSVLAYFGQAPWGGTCFYGWQNTGNLTNNADPTARWFLDNSNTPITWAAVTAAVTELLKEVDIIVDSGWIAPRGQAFEVDNFTINNKVMNAADIQHAYGH